MKMAGIFQMENREVIRVTVKKCEGLIQPEYKRFCIDPQITSFEVLQSLLSRAFNTKASFTISYLAKDSSGKETYLSMLSDWDLDAAFISASDPCLRLKIDFKPFDEGLEDWDIIGNKHTPQPRISHLIDRSSLLGSIKGTITTHVGKTVSHVSKAIGLKNDDDNSSKPMKQPMSDAEFHNFLDGVGVLVRPQEFRLRVYQGGVHQSLRRVVWRHLLNIYPVGMTGKERFEYLKKKSTEYYKLRDEWLDNFSQGRGNEEVKYVTNMVKKDVLRTDRTHSFYAGDDDNCNVLSLFNILVTYALTHPTVSYCQGMSDIASPILVIQKDEAHAYVCFCGLMQRLKSNFLLEGEIMNAKFQHLALLLQHHDVEFFNYLKHHKAEDLFFCYRWLLLEMKREFPFDEALLMQETMWSSLPPSPPRSGLSLTDPHFKLESLTYTSPSSPATNLSHGSNAYMRLMSMRRHTHSPKSSTPSVSKVTNVNSNKAAYGNFIHGNIQNGTCHLVRGDENDIESVNTYVHCSVAETIMTTAGETCSPVGDDHKYYPSLQDMLPRSSIEKCDSIEKSLQYISMETGMPATVDDKKYNDKSTESTGTLIDRINIQSQESSLSDGNSSAEPSSLMSSYSGSLFANSRSPVKNFESSISGPPVLVEKDVPTISMSMKGTSPNGVTTNTHPANNETDTLPRLEKGELTTLSFDKLDNTVSMPTSPKRPTDIPLKEVSILTNRLNIPSSDVKPALMVNQQGVLTERAIHVSTISNISSCEEVTEPMLIEFIKVENKLPRLPAPQEFGCGNPFLIFLCLTLLLQHRDFIMRNHMDYNELAMHFDKMVRKHNVWKVLQQAKSLYGIYLRNQAVMDSGEELDGRLSV